MQISQAPATYLSQAKVASGGQIQLMGANTGQVLASRVSFGVLRYDMRICLSFPFCRWWWYLQEFYLAHNLRSAETYCFDDWLSKWFGIGGDKGDISDGYGDNDGSAHGDNGGSGDDGLGWYLDGIGDNCTGAHYEDQQVIVVQSTGGQIMHSGPTAGYQLVNFMYHPHKLWKLPEYQTL